MEDDESEEEIEKYKMVLDQGLVECFDQKYIVYKGKYFTRDYIVQFYFSDLTKQCNKTYKTEFTFNYYLLIEKKHYKMFKKINPIINGYTLDYKNSTPYYFGNPIINLAKFMKPHYKKEIVSFNEITFIKIKLRALNNSFVPTIDIRFDVKNEIYDYIKFIAVPVKKRYTNLIKLVGSCYPTNDDTTPINQIKSGGVCIDINSDYMLLSDYTDKKIENTIEYIKDNEKIFFNNYTTHHATLFNKKTYRCYPINIRLKSG